MNSKRKKSAGNLKPWKKGQSGNPAGRPPIEKTFSTAAREMLKAQEITISWAVGYAQKQRTLKAAPSFNHVLAAVLIMEGLDGNVRAISELLDRAEGRPAQTVFETSCDPIKNMTDEELDAEIKRLKEIIEPQGANSARTQASKPA